MENDQFLKAEQILSNYETIIKDKIVAVLTPAFEALSNGHVHFTKELGEAIMTDIKNC
jgi:hypothetical protein